MGFDFSSGLACPVCKTADIKLNNGGVFCDCGFKIFRKFRGYMFSDDDLKRLIDGGSLLNVPLKKKDGARFSANVRLNSDYETELYWDN